MERNEGLKIVLNISTLAENHGVTLFTFSYKESHNLDYNVILNSDPNVSQHNSDTICFKFYGCVATRYQDVSRLLPITYHG